MSWSETITETFMPKKKKSGMKTETNTGTVPIGPIPEPVVAKARPSCGFEYNGSLYKTLDEANVAYQIDLIRKKWLVGADVLGAYNPWRGGAIVHWDELRAIAHMKLEVE